MIHSEKEIEFVFHLSEDLQDRLRVLALKQKGEIVKFVVQYEVLIKNLWRPIITYLNRD